MKLLTIVLIFIQNYATILVRFDFGKKFKALSLINPYYIISQEGNAFHDIVGEFSRFLEDWENEKEIK